MTVQEQRYILDLVTYLKRWVPFEEQHIVLGLEDDIKRLMKHTSALEDELYYNRFNTGEAR